MESISGTYHDGQVTLNGSVQWPDGCKVNVTVSESAEDGPIGLDEQTWKDSQENRNWLVSQWEQLEAPAMTEAEWAQWQAARDAVKQYTLHKMQHRPPPSNP